MKKLFIIILLSLPYISYAQVPAIKGYLFTDKGTPIEAYIVEEKYLSNATNNHGWTFANGKFWIHHTQIPIILKDEYKQISFSEIKDKDILIRYDENGKVKYSLTACVPPNNSTTCDDKLQPDLFLFVLQEGKKLNYPESTKIYRYIKPVK